MDDNLFAPRHASVALKTWRKLQDLKAGTSMALDGRSLDVASVVAVARHGLVPHIKEDAHLKERLQQSINVLNSHLDHDWVIYGVNTGFGGSADARTEKLRKLQISLLQHTQSAIITTSDVNGELLDRDGQSHAIPTDWVKAAILARANQNLRGHSGVRLEVIDTLLKLLRFNITPVVPLRGTISASGDLMPLSYIAGTLTGSPEIQVRHGPSASHRLTTAQAAFEMHSITPIELAPKEGLGLINGTAPSVALAALIVHESQQLAILAQLLTAFTAESLAGNVEWSNPFIHAIRPHPGQREAASTIRALLKGSTFVTGLESRKRTGEGLWQDRYSTRTAPQWLGPYLEDLLLAQRQVEIELNSTSDNPVIDTTAGPEGDVYSGGNFQATAVTSAMDKTKNALQMIGRMVYSQCTELINPSLNNGLDANLVFGDPDNSYTMKGIDVNMSAYMAELAALAHPVSAHVQSAELHNQGINSLAFLSARRTMEALDVLAHMCACHAYVCCQAIDLRTTTALPRRPYTAPRACILTSSSTSAACRHALPPRSLPRSLARPLLAMAQGFAPLEAIAAFEMGLCKDMLAWVADPANDPEPAASVPMGNPAMPGLGQGSSVLYGVVRGALAVPFNRGVLAHGQPTIGSDVSKVYEAVRLGTVMDAIMGEISGIWEEQPAPKRAKL
ncbi:phenylalanine ammonia-lyase [Verticillium alfalfae VaMs.102]|uniref:Phenylalanine ammonia-lyase n=1 Tax=Verticillium alfalfae (strain VaMs.102 / ATCC MYA-4576 / FGSC 10136) TaxID=526221 RepID=C9STE1_VERA1|nr:phenylalanine ammonia-lyase [Verticillium alfalfae VaMs.102]EEY22056.1 phenylalanine ammonia-lyase [Verticillium alfalfae VaMs.102]